MPDKCPLCGQSLPHALNHAELQSRIQKLSSPALAAERAKLKAQTQSLIEAAVDKNQRANERLLQTQLREAERQAEQRVQRSMEKRIADAEKRAKASEERRAADIQRARKEGEVQAKRLADAQNETKIQKIQADRERERMRDAERASALQSKVDDLQRRLENQSGERLGNEAERDLFAELRAEFPLDRFERIGRGVKGADILHSVMDGSKVVGKIVYESKNTLTWLNEFIVQAKRYKTLYETPHVIVVTRVFPSKQKGFCVVKDIPVVASRMAVPLATIIREAIIEIAKLRMSGNDRNGKSQELYEYIASNSFCERFRELSEGVDSLRLLQQNERRWHERTWQEESKLHDLVANRHSEVDAQIKSICHGAASLERTRLPARSALSTDRRDSPFLARSAR